MSWVLLGLRSFFAERDRAAPWTFFQFHFTRIANFLTYTTNHTLQLARTSATTLMATLRKDSKFNSDNGGDIEFARRMVHLQTKEECRLSNETIQVWTVELPSKHAEGILKVIKDKVPEQDLVDLQHLRRFAKPKYLPAHVLGQRDLVKEMYAVPRAWEATPVTVMQAPQTSVWEYATPSRARNNGKSQTLHLLICPTRAISLRDLYEILKCHTPFCSSADSWAYPLEIKQITVPLLPPTSSAQAEELSTAYWPTFYRKTNPFGAHPASIAKAEEELHNPPENNIGIDDAMLLAEKIGAEGVRRGIGAGPGCVIVERIDGKTNIIAVASDARYRPQAHVFADDNTNTCGRGNMMGHAVMRAVGMVGRKRLRVASTGITKAAAKAESNFTKGGLALDEKARDAFFLDLPVMESEEEYFKVDNLKPDGYLSLKLEIVLTHEPCIMCCMALVHSRVGRVVFKHRMPQTGGLTAEMVSNNSGPVGLGYGLCWRKELNWQFMCWEYIIQVGEEGSDSRQDDRKDSEKYPAKGEETVNISSANVTVSSFARGLHV